jgi:tRNA pseudouridine55 synthase
LTGCYLILDRVMDGILNINKPAGMTSYAVVAAVKRVTREKHVGHAGTLDPDATGVLPVCIGKGTRIIEFLMDAHKVYRAVIELGITTDTYDATGKIVSKHDPSCVAKDMLEMALHSFRGTIKQIPPMYSALKHQGQPLYELAREGISIERKSRDITIYRLELTDWHPPLFTLEIECSKGTYIRSLANDLGEMLGSGAYMKNLVRTGYGSFKIEDAITLDQLKISSKEGDWQKYLHPIDSVLEDLPKITVDEAGVTAIKTGTTPKLIYQPETTAMYLRAYGIDGRFLAILSREKESSVWHPKKVFI